ncbi:hypothetical protein [Adhaeribacter terreus]|uniref:Uncharacterized protein n=1 Tax=Adhaeribacter terreus TaxID=529703 RepID=A0ABW0EB01_9BACT
MKGEELIQSAIGQKLKEGKLQSFLLKGELVDRINVTFLKFDKWIRIMSTDEMTQISKEEDSFGQVEFYGDDEFKYPIEHIDFYFPEFRKYIGKQLLGYKEIVLKNNESLSFGINLYFEDNLNFLVHNQNYPVDRNEYIFENLVPKELKER